MCWLQLRRMGQNPGSNHPPCCCVERRLITDCCGAEAACDVNYEFQLPRAGRGIVKHQGTGRCGQRGHILVAFNLNFQGWAVVISRHTFQAFLLTRFFHTGVLPACEQFSSMWPPALENALSSEDFESIIKVRMQPRLACVLMR